MKRNKITTIIATLMLVLFAGCEKESTDNIHVSKSNIQHSYYFLEENFIQNIMDEYGIDILELSQSSLIRDLAQNILKTLASSNVIGQTKNDISDYQISQLQSLLSAIQDAYNNGDENELFSLYESLCALCHDIDGFIFQESEYGFELFTYNQSQNPVYIPISFMEHSQITAKELYFDITHQYPNFDALDYNTQWNVIAAAIYCNIAQEKTTNPNDKEECLNEALRMYAVSMTAATAAYEAALIGCGFSGPGVVGCVILASSTYGVAMAVAAWQYKRAVKRC